MPITPPEPFGFYVRRIRLEKNLTQQEVEQNGGPKQSTISDYENSAETITPRVPTRRMVVLFAKGLNVPIGDVEKAAGLLPGSAQPPIPIREVQSALEKAGRVPSWLSTGDVVYLAMDDPDPDETLVALEAFLIGWRQGWQAREARKRRRASDSDAVTPPNS